MASTSTGIGTVVWWDTDAQKSKWGKTAMNTEYGLEDGESISGTRTYGKYRVPQGATNTNEYYDTFAKTMVEPAQNTVTSKTYKIENDSGKEIKIESKTIDDYFESSSSSSYSWERYRYLMNRGKLPWTDETFTGGNDDESLDDGTLTAQSHSLYSEKSSYATQDTRQAIIHGVGLYEANAFQYLRRNIISYNRYKLPVPDGMLQRSFAHIFFVKPHCNIILTSTNASTSGNDTMTLTSSLKNNQDFAYARLHAPYLLYELTDSTTLITSDFSLLLSNAVQSFSLSDESLESDSYGKALTGYQIAYGKHDAASKSAGEFTISFQDDKELHIYQLLKLWTSYISGCYSGTIVPTYETITEHLLDYAGAVYYFLTGEDGESIIFWSKYYGIFPVNSPSSMLGWSYGNLLSCPKYDVSFKYSMKRDLDPNVIAEFNGNAHITDNVTNGKNITYMSTFDPDTLGPGRTWVGVPYIETTVDGYGWRHYKLRFTKPKSDSNSNSLDNDTSYYKNESVNN